MKILPAIDILGGKCVRLTNGEFSAKKVYSSNPLAMGKKFEQEGAKMLHIVDLDAAKTGKPMNQELIINIARAVKIPVEVGGGIREIKTAKVYLNSGVERIVIGTKVLTDAGFVTALIQKFGSNRILVAVEIKQDKVAIKGWQETLDKNYLDFARELKALGVTEILFTDVDRDGSLTEPNFEAIGNLIELGFNVLASGGVSDLESVKKLKKLGAWGAILGKALYEDKLSLKNVLDAAKPISNLTKRIITCLDVKAGQVVKGFRFRNHLVMGGIVDFASRYCEQGADELVFYDIAASAEDRIVSADWVKQVAQVVDIPFCVAGGIASVADARRILQSGADKISINSPALENPDLINKLAREFGSQCVVVGIDSSEEGGEYFVKQYTGDPKKTRATRWRTFDWAHEAQTRGAGEIVLNCMNQDGVRQGYDIAQIKKISGFLKIPVVASGGAGKLEDFRDVFLESNADAALAASVFHNRDISISRLKKYLSTSNIPIRL